MQHRPYRHVQQEKDRGGQAMDQENVHHGKGESDANDAGHRLSLGQPQSDELVMDMIYGGYYYSTYFGKKNVRTFSKC